MLHLLCTLVRLATTSVAGGATLSYNQLAGADAAPARFHVRCSCAAPLSSQPLGCIQDTIMANFLVYWQDFWNDPGDPREVKGNWASNSDVLFDRANPGDVFWVVITGPEGKRDEWRLLARLVITGKATKATRYGRYFFPGDPERSAVLPIVGQPDLAPILWLLRFEGKKPIRAAGRKIGKSLH